MGLCGYFPVFPLVSADMPCKISRAWNMLVHVEEGDRFVLLFMSIADFYFYFFSDKDNNLLFILGVEASRNIFLIPAMVNNRIFFGSLVQ